MNMKIQMGGPGPFSIIGGGGVQSGFRTNCYAPEEASTKVHLLSKQLKGIVISSENATDGSKAATTHI